MNIYSFALFVHIVGTLGFFVSLGLEWTGLWQMGSAPTSDLVRVWMRISKSTRSLGLASMLAILATGAYMTAAVWGGLAWVLVTMGSLVLGVALTLALTGPRMMAIGKALRMEKGPASDTLRSLVNNPILWISIQTRLAIGLGIIFLKIVKPDLVGSLLVIAVAIALGLVSALPFPRRAKSQEGVAA